MSKQITVLGDGGWGTAAGILLAEQGHKVTIWGYDALYLVEMEASRENDKFLPGVRLPESIRFESDMSAALRNADVIVVAIPTQFLRSSLQGAKDLDELISDEALVISLVKGIEQESGARPSEILSGLLCRRDIAVLSGPSHAEEVARGLPCSVVIAAADLEKAQALQELFSTSTFRAYTSDDAVGVELGGALKNVIAVAVGICNGLGLGDNACSALMTRGLVEMTRFGVAQGGKAETFAGLSGMGDLITTCVSPHGRNRAVGLAIGQGQTLAEILASTPKVPEGVATCKSLTQLARAQGIDMPITEVLYEILYENKDPRHAVTELMTRSLKPENA